MNKVQELFNESRDSSAFARKYLDHLSGLLGKLDSAEISRFIEILWTARENGSMIFFMGNGGSAATASHFVNDLTIGTRTWHKPFKAICLSDNVAGLTAIANDYGYEDVFVLPLKTQLKKGDVVVAISASGNSPNLLKAVEYANAQGAVTVGLTGFDGGKLKQMAKACVHAQTTKGEYGPVEDIHMILDHLVGAFMMYQCAKENCK